MDREILHILPQEFTVDDQKGIKDPSGMAGIRLEVDVHIVTGAVSSAQNLVKAIQQAGYQVRDLVLEPLASSFGVLTDDERELGVALLDIGGGTTDIALFHEGSIRHTAVIGLGGNSVTNDIAIGLRTPARDAERIKERYGAALASMVDPDEEIVVPHMAGQGERRVSRELLASIIQPRMEEILSLAKADIKKTGWHDKIPSGFVLTGGAAALPGTVELAERILSAPVRIGHPLGVTGLVDSVDEPRFATGVGLVIYGRQAGREDNRFASGDDDTLWARVLADFVVALLSSSCGVPGTYASESARRAPRNRLILSSPQCLLRGRGGGEFGEVVEKMRRMMSIWASYPLTGTGRTTT
jgi:cell division protein FtsA